MTKFIKFKTVADKLNFVAIDNIFMVCSSVFLTLNIMLLKIN